jgi:diguanylate cyclase (GGDEF)-like protein
MSTSEINRVIPEEISQAIVRILICSLGLFSVSLIYIFDTITPLVFYIIGIYFIFSLYWWFHVKHQTGDFPFRRRLIALSDLGLVSICMHFSAEWGVIYFFAYLWIIVGNGMRFGSRAIIESTAIGIFYFSVTIINTQYWIENSNVAIGLMVGLVLLPLYYLILIQRLTKVSNKLAEELSKANYAATHDALTGLTNRSYFYQRLKDKVNEAKRYNEKFIVMYIDLDGFKKINDTWGHHRGDMVLQAVSERFKTILRISDVVGRLGGDEFSLLLHSVDNDFDVNKFSQKVIDIVSEPIIIEGQSLQVTASIGVSLFPDDEENAEQLINSADESMYASKRNGKNKFTLNLAHNKLDV